MSFAFIIDRLWALILNRYPIETILAIKPKRLKDDKGMIFLKLNSKCAQAHP